jgi:hypothetical protein
MWMRAAAEQGHTHVQLNLAEAYREREGVEQDFDESAKWYRAAAEGGDPGAPLALGMMYCGLLGGDGGRSRCRRVAQGRRGRRA